MRRIQTLAVPLALALLCLVPVHAAAPGDAQAAAQLMEGPAGAAVGAVPEGVDDKRSSEALQAGAYLSAISLAADATVVPEQERAWEESQGESEPGMAFLQHVLDEWHAVRIELQDSLGVLENASRTVHAGDAGRLLVAAHLLVEAEVSHDLTGRFLTGSAQPEYVRTADQRQSFLRPLVVAREQVGAAAHLLEATPSGAGPVLDLARVDAAVTERGGALPNEFLLGEAGPIHRLARHVTIFESNAGNSTVEQLRQSLEDLENSRRSWPAGVPQERAAVVDQDVSWWLSRAESEYAPGGLWDPLLATLHGYVRGTEYEAEMLALGVPEGDAFPWVWVAVGGGVLAIGLAGALAFVRLRRRSSRDALHAVWLPAVALAVLAALLAQAPGASAEPLPAAPTETAVAFTGPDHTGGWGGVAVDGEGLARFTWIACPPPETPGCYDVWGRSFDPGTGVWSEPTVLRDSPVNTSIPRLVPGSQGDYLVWIQKDTPDGPILLKACALDGGCDPFTLSDPGADAGNAVGAVGPDGRLRVAWQEELPESARIVFRMHDGTGWKPAVLFETESPAQRHPTLAVDSTGRSHLAWQEGVAPGNKNAPFRTLHYGTVDAAGTTVTHTENIEFVGLDVLTQPSVAVQDGDVVGLAFNNLRDTYFIEREAGDVTWSDPINVTRTNSFSTQSALQLMPAGDDWVLAYRTGSTGDMRFWRADRVGGMWLTPQTVVAEPFDTYLLSPTAVYSGSGVHMAWSGQGPEASEIQMHYRLLDPEPPGFPPNLTKHRPSADAWTRGPDVDLVLHFDAAAPLDMDNTRLRVDGSDVPLQVGTRAQVPVIRGTASGLFDGAHEAVLDLVDQHGRSTQSSWTFHTDSSAPRLELAWRVGQSPIPDASGWQGLPVSFEAHAMEDQAGSPVRVEISVDDGATYFPLTEAAQAVGFQPSEGAWMLPEGVLLDLRLRARDEAGNIDASSLHSVGWDQSPPQAAIEAASWSQGPAVVHVNASEGGSPVTTVLRLLTSEGETAAEASVGGDGNAALSVPEGSYVLHVDVTDAAGNRMEPTPGPWTVGVDATAPSVGLSGNVLEMSDAGSGLGRVEITSGQEVLVQADLNGTSDHAQTLPWPDGVTLLRAVIVDVAGNAWSGDLDRAAGALSDPEPVVDLETGDVQGTTGDRADSKWTPGAATPWVLLAVAASAMVRRRP